MLCPSCGSDNREGARFCADCGAKLESACPACGAAVVADQKFCDSCGHGLGTAAGQTARVTTAAPAPVNLSTAGERRQVTVLFADLSGFTKLSQELDAEDTHALLNRFFAAADAAITEYGGHIDKHIGDNVMAVFGAPTAHSNDPERAVRAALDIHAAAARLDPPLGVHIGLAAGTVVASGTGSDAHQEYTVTGETVNLAARLQDAAQRGETLIADEVYREVSGLFRCESAAGMTLKGIEGSVRAWRVLALLDSAHQGQARAFVGRRRETRQFAAILEACAETGNGECVYLRGEVGVGKTRLLEEFRRLGEARGFACHRALILDFGTGKGRDAIRVLVRGLLGLGPSAGSNERASAADAAISADGVGDERRAHLNDLLDLPQPADLRALYDAMDYTLRNEGKRKALGELLAAASAARPVLLLVEDVQWADAPVLADLAYLARALFEYRAVLVMTSRVDGDPLDAAWRATARGVELTTIDLPPLREKEATEMAAAFVDTQSEFAAACVARAEGNPMFLEQLLRSAEEATAGTVPGSVQSSVLARMDMLDDRDRRALRAAAVIGQRFSLELLRHLLGDGGFSCTSLIEHYLVQPEGAEYLFGHSLIRDGAYASLLKSNRHELHERAAMWFKDRDPILHAEHLARAESLLAPGAYLEAAQGQAGDFHFETAQGLCADGLALEPEPQTRCALLCLQGDALRYLGENETSIESFRGALDCGTSDRDRCRAWLGVAGGMRVLDRYDEALDALAQAEKATVTDADPADVARIHFDRGNIFFPTGNIEGCLEEHEAARKYSRAAGSAEGEARALGGLGDAYYQRGRMITANKHFDDCIKLCREHGFVRIEVANLHMRGYTRFYNIDLAGGWEDCRTAAAMAQRIGLNRAEIVARMGGCMLLHAGDPKAAQEELHRGLALTRRIGARRFEAWFLAFLAKAAFVEGRGDEAVTLVTEAVAISRETGLTFVGPMCLGILALVTEDPTVRGDALAEAEKALAEECVSHNYLFFYIDAIAVCIRIGELSAVLRYADALEEYFRAEPLRWSDYYVRWGRALAAFGAGGKNEENLGELRRLRQQAGELRLAAALPVLDAALGESPARAPLGVAD